VPFLFTQRAGGVSTGPYASLNLGDHVGDDPQAVVANRRRLTVTTGVPVHFMRQVHGADVLTFSRAGGFAALGSPEADAMVTDIRGFGLGVLVADCVPVMLVAPGAVGVAHAGRKGLAAGVVPAALVALEKLGVRPAEIHAEIGPSVCGRCYEVPVAMRDEVEAAVPGTATTTRAGTPALDLRAGVAAQVRAAGVADVTVSDRCTMEDPELFSHRRDNGRTGRFAGIVWL
jgi:YfiH family protein